MRFIFDLTEGQPIASNHKIYTESQMEGLQRAENPTQEYQKFLRRDVDGGGGGAARPSAALVPSAPAATSAHHATLSSCPLQVTRVGSLAAVLHGGAAAFGRSGHWQRGLRPAGAFGARWHLHSLDFGRVINLT